jgi:RHS repeat-associated protein
VLSGYAIDTDGTTGTGVDQVDVYGCPVSTWPSCSWTFWGTATYGVSRPDIATAYGDARFTNSGFQLLVTRQPADQYIIYAWAHSTVWNSWFLLTYGLTLTPNVSNLLGAITTPATAQPVAQPFNLTGWAIDAGDPGPGVDAVVAASCLLVNCLPTWTTATPPTYGSARTDVASTYGSTFLNSGFSTTISGLVPGQYFLVTYFRSALTGGWAGISTMPYVDEANPTLSLDRLGAGTGGVTATGLTCAGGPGTQAVPCSATYAFNTAVTLTAVSDTGSVFVGWTGACSGTSTCAVTMAGAQYVAARFVPVAGSPGLTFYHTDTIGSVRALTNESGTTIIRHDYGAFGEDTAAMTGDPLRFGGKELDPETGLENFEARYYRQTWGRFSAVDPIGGLPSDPQSFNRYAYARNNPLRFVDPTGMSNEDLTFRVGVDWYTSIIDNGYSFDYFWINNFWFEGDRCSALFINQAFYGVKPGSCVSPTSPFGGGTIADEGSEPAIGGSWGITGPPLEQGRTGGAGPNTGSNTNTGNASGAGPNGNPGVPTPPAPPPAPPRPFPAIVIKGACVADAALGALFKPFSVAAVAGVEFHTLENIARDGPLSGVVSFGATPGDKAWAGVSAPVQAYNHITSEAVRSSTKLFSQMAAALSGANLAVQALGCLSGGD